MKIAAGAQDHRFFQWLDLATPNLIFEMSLISCAKFTIIDRKMRKPRLTAKAATAKPNLFQSLKISESGIARTHDRLEGDVRKEVANETI
jgi:hypothetical protein